MMEKEKTCYEQPCFVVEPSNSTIGKCTKNNVYIMVELAKKERLCDYEKEK
jgi:hypothetical protein